MSNVKPETYYIQYIVIPAKGLIKLQHPFSINKSLKDIFNISAFMQFAMLPANIRYRLPWTSGTARTKIKLICWRYAGPLRRDLTFKSIY